MSAYEEKIAARATRLSNDLDRYEAKYLVHASQLSAMRDFIAAFCVRDAHTIPDTSEYIITTLQLDTHDMALFSAKDGEAINRFKLRVRTYGLDGTAPVFLEIKRKIKGVIAKSRAQIPYSLWGKDTVVAPTRSIPFHSRSQEHNYLEFVRLVTELDARPKILLRYTRESYLGINDHYARVTFDRKLCYRPTQSWELLPSSGHWWNLYSEFATVDSYPFIILELKTYGDTPHWMVDMTERFDLVRIGFSKYYAAVCQEKLFSGGACIMPHY